MFYKIKASVKFAYPELKALINKNLPDFVYNDDAKINNSIIIFSYHTPDPILLDKHICFLVKNNYKLITTSVFHDYILGFKSIPPNCIMLTFDDCRASLWTVVYPILKKYGVSGVAYLSPYFISEYKKKRSQWSGNGFPGNYVSVDNSDFPFSSWDEIYEMHDSGVIDFQGHTYYHELVFVSDKIVDFLNPYRTWDFNVFGIPVILEGNKDRYDRVLSYGTPIYEMDLRTSGKLRFYDDEGLRENCINYVRNNGGENFFKKRSWKKQLLLETKKYKDLNGDKGYFEKSEDMKSYLRKDLLRTVKEIENRLPGKKVTSMCFPWEIGSDIAIDLARETGYLSCVWGIIPGRKTNRAGDDPYHVCRLSNDFILRLPGNGRICFTKFIMNKVNKRLNIFNKL